MHKLATKWGVAGWTPHTHVRARRRMRHSLLIAPWNEVRRQKSEEDQEESVEEGEWHMLDNIDVLGTRKEQYEHYRKCG